MAIQQIQVSVGAAGSPVVNVPDVTIWSTNGDQVQWTGAGPFEIYFPSGTPFASDNFVCLAGSSAPVSSGPINSGATGTFKYNVSINGKVLDPKIKIKP